MIDIIVDKDTITPALLGYIRSWSEDGRRRLASEFVLLFLKRSVQLNYEKQGRPRPWLPLSPKTEAKRESLGMRGPILNMTGRDPLTRFRTFRVDSEEVHYGTSSDIVRWHEKQRFVKPIVLASPIVPDDVVAALSAGAAVRRTSQDKMTVPLVDGARRLSIVFIAHPRSHDVKSEYPIPARPVVGMTIEDADKLADAIQDDVIHAMREEK